MELDFSTTRKKNRRKAEAAVMAKPGTRQFKPRTQAEGLFPTLAF